MSHPSRFPFLLSDRPIPSSRACRLRRDAAGLGAVASLAFLAACGGGGTTSSVASGTVTVPGAPTIGTATAGDGSAAIAFSAPASNGGATITAYTASCTGGGSTKSATGSGSPVTVTSLTNGTAYSCSVTATNSAGTGPSSATVAVTPAAATTASAYPAVYKSLSWEAAASVSYSGDCSMTIATTGVPAYHAAYYLAPVTTEYPTQVATTPVSGMAMSVVPYTASSINGSTATINICPQKATSTTSTNMGVIGYMLTGEALFNPYEGGGAQTPALSDNVSYTFTDSSGATFTASFIDKCNSHPTPLSAGYDWHYHGVPTCLTATVDLADGPSHLIGIALDGFPIYGGRDISGNVIDVSTLDSCNGITSPTPEFPSGIYHYVLPVNVTGKQSSLNCYSGTVSQVKMALAKALACTRRYARLTDRTGPDGADRSRAMTRVVDRLPPGRRDGARL